MKDVISNNRGQLLKWLITVLIPLAVYFIPLNEFYTADLRTFFMITIFVILLVAFEFFDVLVPALLLQTLYLLSGIVPVEVAYGSWSNTTVWMILGALILANVLEECGLLQRIAYWCINKCGGTFTGTLYGIFLTGIVISTITFGNGFIIMVTMAYGVCLAMNLKKSTASALVCFMGMLGGETTCCFIYNPGYLSLGVAGIQQFIPDFAVNWYTMLIYQWPLLVLCLLVIWLFSKMYKTKDISFDGGKEYFRKVYADLGPMTKKEKKALVILAILMIYLVTCPIHGFSDAYGFMLIPYLLFVPGISVGSVETIKKTNFSIIFFIASCFSIGTVGSALGVGDLISNLVSPMLAGKGSLFSLLIMMTFGVFANLFMTPFAMMAGLSASFAQVAIDIGINPLASIMTLMTATDMVFFPYEVAPYLVVYGFGLISMKDFITMHGLKTILTYIFFAAVMYPYWTFLGFI